MSVDFSKIQKLLGGEAETLLGHVSKTIPKDSLHLPGSDFIDRVWMYSDRTPIQVRPFFEIPALPRMSSFPTRLCRWTCKKPPCRNDPLDSVGQANRLNRLAGRCNRLYLTPLRR